MLKNNVIIYDHECPLCNAYTGTFIKFKLLDENGREKYANLENFSCNFLIDKDKARHEIALIDTETQEVRYGLNSLLHILQSRFPWLRILFEQKFFILIMSKLYLFISYNRKVIAPSSKETPNSCVPDFNLKYRLAYLFFALSAVSFFAFYFEVFAFWSAFCLLLVILSAINKGNRQEKLQQSVHYLGHRATILLIGCVLLIPSIYFHNLLIHNALLVVLVISKEWWRRKEL